ncbi:MAG: hypothetical protein P8L64_06880, partial [Flavobacteriales bacterium]|nr:hypothetical protein [Flavobacteriales bacterium]
TEQKGITKKKSHSSIGIMNSFNPKQYASLNPQTPARVNKASQIKKATATIEVEIKKSLHLLMTSK